VRVCVCSYAKLMSTTVSNNGNDELLPLLLLCYVTLRLVSFSFRLVSFRSLALRYVAMIIAALHCVLCG